VLSEVTVEVYEKIMKELTMSQFLAYRTFIKQLSQLENLIFTFISGGSSESTHFMPTASLIPVSASTNAGICIAAWSEFKNNKNVAINQLRLFCE
jgi:hypothetical protein